MCGGRDTQSGDERESSRQQKAEKARNTDHQGESAETGSPGSIPASCSGAGGLGAAPAWPPPLLSIIPSYKDLIQSHRLHPLIQAHAFEHLQSVQDFTPSFLLLTLVIYRATTHLHPRVKKNPQWTSRNTDVVFISRPTEIF